MMEDMEKDNYYFREGGELGDQDFLWNMRMATGRHMEDRLIRFAASDHDPVVNRLIGMGISGRPQFTPSLEAGHEMAEAMGHTSAIAERLLTRIEKVEAKVRLPSLMSFHWC